MSHTSSQCVGEKPERQGHIFHCTSCLTEICLRAARTGMFLFLVVPKYHHEQKFNVPARTRMEKYIKVADCATGTKPISQEIVSSGFIHFYVNRGCFKNPLEGESDAHPSEPRLCATSHCEHHPLRK